MDETLEIVGLVAAVIAGFLVTPALGFTVVAASCLWVAWRRARDRRLTAEKDERDRLERLAR